MIANNIPNFERFRQEILNEIKEDLNKMLDTSIIKAHSPMLDKANVKKRKKVKKVLQSAQPSEYMGQDFTKLGDLLSELQDLDTNKSDKKMMKKLEKFDEKNLDLVSRASELRKDYELLYRQLRGLVYPKSQGDLGEEKDE
jgi:3-methyladenine DNA glycosylase Tag